MYVTRGAQATFERVMSPKPKKSGGLAARGMLVAIFKSLPVDPLKSSYFLTK
jgi:hypothetical protein